MVRHGQADAAELQRIAAVLDGLLADPTLDLRRERREIVQAVRRTPDDLAARRLLAAHYRALGKPDQAARWGITEPGWATDDEIAELRLVLLERDPWHATSRYLGIGYDDALPEALADLERRPPQPKEGPLDLLAGLIMILGILAIPVGVLSLLAALVLWGVGMPLAPWLLPTALVCGAIVAVATPVAVLWTAFDDRRMAAQGDHDPHARELERLLPTLDRALERRALGIACLRSKRPPTRAAARRALVDAARELDRADEVARWGAALEGVTTDAEREAFARRLAGVADPAGAFLSKTRARGSLGADERDVLRRAGVSEADVDALATRVRARR